jgi:molybdopterin converting factor small subunit
VAGAGDVVVEFFGVPRLKAGRPTLHVAAGSAADVLLAVEQACPGLTDLIRADGRLTPHYLLSVDGREFLTSLDRRLRPGDRLVILSADAGG